MRRLALILAVALSVSAAAQRTFVVDAQNRPGTDFTDLPPAVAFAASGDVLLVRDGNYQGFQTGKGLRILGVPGVMIFGFFSRVEIADLPANAEFVMQGVSITAIPFRLARCEGRVLLEDVRGPTLLDIPSLDVTSCRQVTLSRCTLGGAPGLNAAASTVFVNDCTLSGQDAVQSHVIITASPALIAFQSEVLLSRGTIRGGSTQIPAVSPPATGMMLLESSTRLTGDAATTVSAGTGTTQPIHAIVGAQGLLTIDPVVRLVPNGGADPIGPGLPTVQRPIASLRTGAAPLGGVVPVDLAFTPGASFFLFAGLPGERFRFVPFGDVWLDPLLILPAGGGTLDASGRFARTANVPDHATLRGVPFRWQAVTVDGSGAIELSHPATYVHR
jgi:hypothetical protein